MTQPNLPLLAGAALLAWLATNPATGADKSLVRLTTDGHFKQRPMWSPDGKWLVFARHRGSTIYLFLRPQAASPALYALGFVLATACLHGVGIAGSLIGRHAVRLAGIAIAATGFVLVLGA